jgi:hypothetical protein
MQHYFEFIAEKKSEPGETPLSIRRVFRTESNRKQKVAKQIFGLLEKNMGVKEEHLESFYLRQLK